MRNGAIVLGTFDGIHKGHMAVLDSAKEYNPKTVITFAVPPAMDEQPELILTAAEKNQRLEEMGFSVSVLDFSKVHSIPAADFLEMMDEKYLPEIICCGFNYRFGHLGKGDAELIKSFAEKKGIKAFIAPAVSEGDIRISSSLIRELIKRGEMLKAASLLGEGFSVSGEVLHGDSRGRTIGIPTVNFFYPENIVMARHGVYAATAVLDGREYKAVSYIGNRPTYQLDRCICETNILDFSGDAYGKRVKIILREFLREDKKFDSIHELKSQIEKDILAARQ